MSEHHPKDLPASIRARLKNKADEIGLEFNQALQYYAMERFLYRLSRSRWADRLIVKGAVLLRVWDGVVARPTRDIDFLARIDNSPDAVASMIRECLAVESDDGLEFSSDVGVEPIAIEDRYPGVRATIEGILSGARIRVRLDIGVGDLVVPEPGWVDYPTLLDMGAPRILAYQPSTAVAEKFETMISRGLLNSRVKDYYDIWMLASWIPFDGEDLKASLAATFGQRGTAVPGIRPKELGDEYVGRSEVQSLWTAFVKKLGLAGVMAPPSLGEVVDLIAMFIIPVAAAAVAGGHFSQTWAPGEGWR
ncbi:MAG: nucleotidyl transferase AbiEii/AbiGii toxin family protein [Coriobacteriaceae bacterium]|nr:nucleotidyl transferase AbiEii/AbiGii toxin family protein [Coriobacteriaceae bacterium]